MQLDRLDYVVIAAFFLINIAIGIYAPRGSKSLSELFLFGRKVPWWLAGTSMVATTFAADTPLAVTGLVSKYGVAGNWLWWNLVMSGLCRQTGAMLRGVSAIYQGAIFGI